VDQYFELDRVLRDGVFYAANQLYGLTFKQRHDIPVYQQDVRVFEVFDADARPLGLVYFDYFARDNKNGGAWMDAFVHTSKLTGDLAVVYNVANFSSPAAGQPALLSLDDVTTMFHEFGHALHELFGVDTRYPTLSGTTPERDFVEFPSQFNEYWALYPKVLEHYARNWKTGAPMPQELVQKILKARTFNKGYDMTELVAAAMLDMQWHILAPGTRVKDVDAFEKQALEKTGLALEQVPPRYRSTYFRHIWTGGAGDDYSAGYYAYLWTQMLADNAWAWFNTHGGLTRANGERFRRMILSRGNTEDLETLYEAWLGAAPTVEAMKKYRGLAATP
jgi:peptidyl-dipeptidase Dcp